MGLLPHEYMMLWILGCFSVRQQGNWNPTAPLRETGEDILKRGERQIWGKAGQRRKEGQIRSDTDGRGGEAEVN